MATHSSILAWRIPWTEKPGGLQSIGSTKSQTERLTVSLHIGSQHKKTCSKVTFEQHGFELHESAYFFQ